MKLTKRGETVMTVLGGIVIAAVFVFLFGVAPAVLR